MQTLEDPRGRLWYSVGAAMGAWILHGFSGFVITDAACTPGSALGRALSPGGLMALLVVISVLALLVALSGLLVAWRSWHRLTRAPGLAEAQGNSRPEFMALAGIFISLVFTIGIVWGALPPLLVGLCASTR